MFSVKVGRRPIGECQPIEYCEVENKLPVSLSYLPTLHAALSGAAELREDILDASVSPAEESFRKILRLLLDPKNVLPPAPLEDESELGDCDLDLLKLHTIVECLSVAANCLSSSRCRRDEIEIYAWNTHRVGARCGGAPSSRLNRHHCENLPGRH